MAKIVWDGVGQKTYESGVDHGVLYRQDDKNAYSKGVPWNGLTGVTEAPEGGETTDLYADNIKYASLRSAETFGMTIEAYTYPPEFEECDGSAQVTAGVTIGQQPRKVFGFSYRTNIGSDAELTDAYKLHLVYGCTAAPSEKAYETINDSPDAITFSWEVNTTPVPVTGYKPTATMVIDSTKVDKTKLAALEAVLYGSENTEPRLPLPDEVITILKGEAN